jgi:23S rRNA (adenine1618-N6)-methyltransferase
MKQQSNNIPDKKDSLHPRNKHRSRYNFPELIACLPELKGFVAKNKYGNESIDFSDPLAVKTLNKALLIQNYQISFWDIPEGYLCPPIPGRTDYIHYIADLLGGAKGSIPTGNKVRVLDIGLGASCIYPIIGQAEYGWQFVASDIDPIAIEAAEKIISSNKNLKGEVELRLQKHPKRIFNGIINDGERFDVSICNPPFHSSWEEAQQGTTRKWRNLGKENKAGDFKNFGGKNTELWCEGGEKGFIARIIRQSQQYSESVFWFTTLVSKQTNLPKAYKLLENVNATETQTIDMAQGQKTSRILAWTFE